MFTNLYTHLTFSVLILQDATSAEQPREQTQNEEQPQTTATDATNAVGEERGDGEVATEKTEDQTEQPSIEVTEAQEEAGIRNKFIIN